MQPTNPLAIASLCCGVVSILTACVCCYGLPFNVLAIVLGGIAISQINDNPEQEGKPLALAGIATGAFSILSAGAMFAFGIGAMVLSVRAGAAGH